MSLDPEPYNKKKNRNSVSSFRRTATSAASPSTGLASPIRRVLLRSSNQPHDEVDFWIISRHLISRQEGWGCAWCCLRRCRCRWASRSTMAATESMDPTRSTGESTSKNHGPTSGWWTLDGGVTENRPFSILDCFFFTEDHCAFPEWVFEWCRHSRDPKSYGGPNFKSFERFTNSPRCEGTCRWE